jgi:hypothetical protein
MADRKLTRLGCVLLALASTLGAADAPPVGRRAQLDTIARKCHFPPSVLKLRGGQVHIQPPPSASYSQVYCLITATRKAGFRTPLGFVGNETYDPKVR